MLADRHLKKLAGLEVLADSPYFVRTQELKAAYESAAKRAARILECRDI